MTFSPGVFLSTGSRGKSGGRASVAKGNVGQRHVEQAVSQGASQGPSQAILQVAQVGPS